MTDPVVIAVAPNGARKSKADHPRLPLTPSELAECAQDCLDAGASMLHLHVRDAAGPAQPRARRLSRGDRRHSRARRR